MAAITKAWGNRQVASITRKDCVALINAVKPLTANTANTRAKNIAAFLQWCVEQGEIESNPAQRIKRRKVVSRDRVLDNDEIAAVWHKATEVNGRLGTLVKLLLLTGARRDEMASLQWSEVKRETIELPASRTKTGVAHSIHLTDAMWAVLNEYPRSGEFVLNGNFKVTLSNKSRPKLNPEGVARWTLHDLRRTFASGCAALGVRPDVIERCLNHGKKSGVAAVYNRYSYAVEMRAAWEKWSAHVEAFVNERAAAT